MIVRVVTVALAASLAACTASWEEEGAELFRSAELSSSSANAVSCSTCHTVDDADTRKLPGGSLRDVAFRPSWWGGQRTHLLDAVNVCLRTFMRSRPLAASDEDGHALFAYLLSISPNRTAPARPFTVVNAIDDVPRGDRTRGGELYARSCKTCHGDASSGAGRLDPQASRIPDETLLAHGGHDPTLPRLVTIEKVRHGLYFGVGGHMPPFSAEALTDAELSDLLAYLGL